MDDATWVIGSVKDLDFSAFTIAGNTSVAITGNYYLYHGTGALSLLNAFRLQMVAAGVGTPAVVLTQDRRVKISGGANFTVNWSTDTGLRDLLGFTQGNLSGASSYTAASVSPLLWSPAKPLTFELSPIGTLGIRRPLSVATASPYDGSTFVVSHGTRTDQRFSCSHVDVERVYTDDEAGGEWVRLFDECLAKGYSFYVYTDVTEVDGGTSTATLSNGLGPYAYTPSARTSSWDYDRSRGFEWTDAHANITLPCRVVPEYT